MIRTIDQAKPTSKQHKTPCDDCPFRRVAIPGWLGGRTPEQYAALAHSDEIIQCHAKIGPQCAGAAIYRANVSKDPRNKQALRIPKNVLAVFTNIREFLDYHRRSRG